MIMLVATVDPCSVATTSPGALPACCNTLATPAAKPCDWSCGVVGVLVVHNCPASRSARAISVNVPPTSTATTQPAIRFSMLQASVRQHDRCQPTPPNWRVLRTANCPAQLAREPDPRPNPPPTA